ncbi:magnesium protoporphyrin IX methyltransferase [Litoreibacter roseus]|uniref:Magnesium protoporphyrin IX methyltransferase n=1 Tax=Litoreibacter roseus TaxID=2601869 RepID=A0A6N6JEJ6_9RHOB|nr:magnesium protoporphyrin IX methyltransferase [Litoreibacter roseus]GFE64636.1 magnesium protoporphyrin IX methyltransferase [Litoreibacter roseus]
MQQQTAYVQTRARVEDYFDRTATQTWERLTSDAPVSGIRATVRAGRDQMRATMLAQLPDDLTSARILDAGCGTGTMAVELANKGADVTGIDISPSLIDIAEARRPDRVRGSLSYQAGDMSNAGLGRFDYVLAMDSMIYYDKGDIGSILAQFAPRLSEKMIFTLPPRTALLMAMWRVGKLFPRSDRSPIMVPHTAQGIAHAARDAGTTGKIAHVETVNCGFYHSMALSFTMGGQR